MNSETYISLSSDQSISENLLITPQTNAEEENSVIIWYQNHSDVNESVSSNTNNEDFIEIDIFPEWPDQDESPVMSSSISPQNITADDASMSDSIYPPDDTNDQLNNADMMPTSPQSNSAQCLHNFHNIYISHGAITLDRNDDSVNNELKNEDKQKLFDSKFPYASSYHNSVNISCYIEGLVAILKIFNRIDCYIEKFAQMTNNCRCTPSVKRDEVTLSNYLLEVCGAKCDNCSMDFILDKLNTIFLKNVARAQFIPVQQIIDSCRSEIEVPIGASSTSYRYSLSNNFPEPGWLRKWLLKHLGDGVIAGIVYNDLINNNYNCRPCNKVMFRLITGYSDEEFHLTIPVESIKDEIIENLLLQDESIKILKSNILNCQYHNSDFESILTQKDYRFSEMNVLGQIVGTFRERSSDSFRGFVPDEVHHIKIPNMHRNGVMLVVNI